MQKLSGYLLLSTVVQCHKNDIPKLPGKYATSVHYLNLVILIYYKITQIKLNKTVKGPICLVALQRSYELENNIGVLLICHPMIHLSSLYWMLFFKLYIFTMLLRKLFQQSNDTTYFKVYQVSGQTCSKKCFRSNN